MQQDHDVCNDLRVEGRDEVLNVLHVAEVLDVLHVGAGDESLLDRARWSRSGCGGSDGVKVRTDATHILKYIFFRKENGPLFVSQAFRHRDFLGR